MRIAILGGSFDPVHKAHVKLAKEALKKGGVDQVWFMPTWETPLKDRLFCSYEDRCAMLERAISPYRKMHLCTLEKELGAPSYTIKTVKELKRRYPKHTFTWIIGSDQANQLQKWKDIDELISLIHFMVFPRDHIDVKSAYPLQFIEMDEVKMSSHEVKQGKLSWLDDSVRDYIGKHYLYLEDLIKTTMHEKRYRHSLSVANLCVELAAVHNVNLQDAYAAGLLHDVCKQWPYEKSKIWMQHLEPQYLDTAPAIWHGFIASGYVKRFYHVYNKDVLYAIRWHVLGSDVSNLAMILFIADKLDPLRGYDSSETIALCKRNLKQGYLEVVRQQQEYLSKE